MKNDKQEIYFSLDIESDGPIPSTFSMLSFGAVAMTSDGDQLDVFERNLETLEGAKQDPSTMDWWKTQPEAWELCRKNLVEPKIAMQEFSDWVKLICNENNGIPVFVAYPAAFDFTFIYWYLIHFVGFSIFSFNALDIKTYGMAMLGCGFKESTKKNFPNRWKSKRRHTHEAIQDALGQGDLFIKMKKENENIASFIANARALFDNK